MKFFGISFRLSLKQLVSKTPFLVFSLLIALALLVGYYTFQPREESVLEFRAGIVYQMEDPFAAKVVAALEEKITVTPYPLATTSVSSLVEDFHQQSYSVLYVFPKDLKEQVTSNNLHGLIASHREPKNLAASIIDKWMFAAVINEGAPYITAHQLAVTLQQPVTDIEPFILQSFSQSLQEESFVKAHTIYTGTSNAPTPTPKNPPLLWIRHISGMGAVLAFVWGMYALGKQIQGKNQVHASLKSKTRVLYRLSGFSSIFVSLSFLCGILLLPLCFMGTPDATGGNLSPWILYLASILSYTLCLSGLVSLGVEMLSSTEGLLPCGIFGFLFVLIFGGVLFAPGEISPLLQRLGRVFPTTYFIESILSLSITTLLPLCVVGILSLVLALTRAYPHPKRR